ncbi:cobalamin 5'-phosphate synthase [Gluconacetobacter diazotrophicus PA1 5]|uniref:Adenosylcobinamide-GDP ribazoletransferase n=1 Tax=Gluconacetobacter diazotrophicus (strain ATCC 49037 / DSM 5601 / CCUG 37298 / CIP 103539 / LMG 7603 / PAl5) TaxID=272568 RepID=A9HBA0_GLUDA|nr:adenosylcobinamide-GDP ribazoletransferase [Gluconacetobacter diazotrophicus]ACI50955.1 cobalamin 5'-phosphate synthase [Gluconacetobacter diazotrophicus PA1 5]TWB08590.1 cobalamin-5'-phosphate synthase [Gluconacetobacter diazotrophicus]CAP54787.1 putative cobalamin synthase [Gluconacetobacter diazotrophicus PA1 5]
MTWLTRVRADLATGLGLLTRLPVSWLARGSTGVDLARSAWTWPLAGLAIGALGGTVLTVLAEAGIGRLPAAGWAVAAQILLTGGLHEDGLADMADGFGGGRDAARKLAIMRDSRVGSYGVMALGLALLIRATAAADLPHPVAAMAVAGGLGRAAMAGLVAVLPPARQDGMAATMTRIPPPVLVASLLTPVIAARLTLTQFQTGSVCLAACAAAILMGRMARRQVGGQTGDILGATALIIECSVLSVLTAA